MERNLFITDEQWYKLLRLSDEIETPCLFINKQVISDKFDELSLNFPFAKIHYAVKANPADEVVSLLQQKGSNFDAASVYELRQLLHLGVTPDRISYGNTIKKSKDIREFFDSGVRLFVTDSEDDLRNIAKAAPGSKVFIRILTEGVETADWPLSRKFGCHPNLACDLLVLAKLLGLIPYGISFHVGSQQRDIATWNSAISKVKYIFDWLSENENITLKMINMGGGFPANYITRTNEMKTYAEEIINFLKEDFGDNLPEIILEPGRSLVADSGILVTEVVLISRKSKTALYRWVYLDAGKFNGLIETLDEAIKFPIITTKKGELEECVIAGPTCDSQDIMYENYKYDLPLNLAIGDKLYFMTTGAYTSSYCSVNFNGFPPLKTYYIE